MCGTGTTEVDSSKQLVNKTIPDSINRPSPPVSWFQSTDRCVKQSLRGSYPAQFLKANTWAVSVLSLIRRMALPKAASLTFLFSMTPLVITSTESALLLSATVFTVSVPPTVTRREKFCYRQRLVYRRLQYLNCWHRRGCNPRLINFNYTF
jgi:hypothetical protein